MVWLTTYRRIVAPKTTNRRITSLKAFASWAGWPAVLTDYTAPTAAKTAPHPIPEGMDGVRRIMQVTTNEKQRALIALCGYCGCRVAEALAARPSDINLSTMEITIRGKGDRTRVLPISPQAWDVIQSSVYRAFVSGDTEIIGLHDRFARRVITELGARAGLKRSISSHDLRATFATAVFDKTKDVRIVQELLGHASSSTTDGYIGVTQAKMREAVQL